MLAPDRPAASQIEELLTRIRAAAAAGLDWIQIREKDLAARRLAGLVRAAVAAAASRTRIIVNDRLDVAAAIGAGGVHLGHDSLPVEPTVRWCRDRFGVPGAAWRSAPFLVGASCHSLAEAKAAAGDGADYVIFGPIFATPSKLRYGPPQGLDKLAEVCRHVSIPIVAIGGINAQNAAECLRAGVAGIAAIHLFQDAADLPSLVTRLRDVGQR